KKKFQNELRRQAQENGVWLDNSYLSDKKLLHNQKARGTSEHDVYLNSDGKTLTKLNNLVYVTSSEHNKNLHAIIDRFSAHNKLFPNAAYTIKGFMNNLHGNPALVLDQPLIDAERNATKEEIHNYLTSIGFKLDGKRSLANLHEVWSNGSYEIFDARPANVLKGKDGELYFIDTIPHSVEYMNNSNMSDSGIESEGVETDNDVRFQSENLDKSKESRTFVLSFEKEKI
ncbi:MAG: hypothetical protein LBS80_04660, partial [Tannerella sp.]|nr:hypothetical protein [Tannerella sp.]